ncbi:ankyrin and het domain-containing protein [Colletotrichum kahawae]|uniref:Ankyrin and het domain-containing protein n=1 Tax=Colletotrichum kahawae TaxID=34407 RepID=A0AAE0D762_COLKA|nr:ankyrin and het domain-containing protein [Colletotrichum kahawae]
MTAAYQYEPLLSPGSIRLLVLQPSASHDAELRGSLLCMTLAEADYDLLDPYTALSYVWGSDEKPCLIFLDGKEFGITQSLNDALRDLRDATRARRIWADALCINQGDIPERNDQVKQMGKIYGLASSTIIYLGQLTEDAAEVLVATTWKAPEADNEIYDNATNPAADGGTNQAETDALVKVASRGLLSRPWFKRVWVLQELVLSKSPWIQCGRQRVRWDDFCHLLLQKSTNLSAKQPTLLRVLDDMNEIRRGRPRGNKKSLWDILSMRRGFGAADPRDHVYANLGVIDDLWEVRKYLEVDYSDAHSLQRVFSRVAAYILNKVEFMAVPSRIPELLPHVHDMHPEQRLQGLPSWVPDWRYPARKIVSDRFPAHTGAYHVLDIDGMPSILAHTGFVVGTIKSVSAVLPLDRDVVKALLGTEEYSYVRQALLRLYEGIAYIVKRSVYSLNEIMSMPWEGSEFQHDSLCKTLGSIWGQLFEALDQQLSEESPGDKNFIALFSRWISDQVSTRRLFLDTLHDRYERSLCYGIPRLLDRYLESTSDDDISGRRLAFTDCGKFAIVPKQAHKGDTIIVLCGYTSISGDGHPILVVRQKGAGEFQALNATIMEEIIKAGSSLSMSYSHHLGVSDSELPAREGDCVDHFSMVGQGYVDSHPDSPFRQDGQHHLNVFALH